MAEKIHKVGTLVQLKSGGPKMTVSTYIVGGGVEPGMYRCQWFTGGKLNHGVFADGELEAVDVDASKK